MKQIFLILLFIQIIYNKEPNSPKVLKQYKISEIINLIKSIDTKGYRIIDPNNYIKRDDEKELETQLKEVYKKHKVFSFIIVIHSAYLKDENNNDIDLSKYAEILLDEIYNQKIIDKKISSIISIISIEGKIMSMKTHGSVSTTISQQDCFNILSIVNNYFSYGEYSYGTVELAKLISYYLENTGFFARNKRFFYMILLLIFCFCFCYFLALIAQKVKDRRNMRLTMSDEEKLLKIKEFLKKTKVNKKIISDCCIICLESFDNCKSISRTVTKDINKKIDEENKENKENNVNNDANNDANNDILIDMENETNINTNTNIISHEERDIQIEMQNIQNESDNESNVPINYDITDNKISTLPCGHRYHVKCITEWMLHKKNICPMCRERIDVDIPDIDDEDLQNELLNIQIELHPAFALLVFQTINEELTWGAMSLPAVHGGFFSGLTGFALI